MLLALLPLQGCIKEDLAECIYRLTFNFEPPDRPADSDPFFEGVSNISVFAFDKAGIFRKEFKSEDPEQGSVMLINLPDGKYTLIVWAGFTDAQIGNSRPVEGISRIEDFYMPAFTASAEGNVVSPEPLFYGMVSNADIALPPVILSQEVQMVQSTKPFRMRIAGLDRSDYRLVISNNAGRYTHGNVLVPPGIPDRSTVTEISEVAAAAPDAIVVSDAPQATYTARTGMLWPAGLGDRQLTVIDVGTGNPVLTISLSELLEKLPNVDFDDEGAINMIINYRSDVSIDVNLNGWWIIYSNDEV